MSQGGRIFRNHDDTPKRSSGGAPSRHEDVASRAGNGALAELLGHRSGDREFSGAQSRYAAVNRALADRSSRPARDASATGAAPKVSREDGQSSSYRQQDIGYRTHEYDSSGLKIVDTNWGTNLFGNYIMGDGSGWHGGHFLPRWSSRRTGAGIATMSVEEPTIDYRAGNFSNEEHHPETKATVRWEQRSPEDRLQNVRPDLEYNPDGGGGMQVVVQYHYGGWREEGGLKKGQHNILLNFSYDTKMTRTSGIEFGGEFGGDAGKISAKASSSTSVGMAARRWKREIAFESYGRSKG